MNKTDIVFLLFVAVIIMIYWHTRNIQSYKPDGVIVRDENMSSGTGEPTIVETSGGGGKSGGGWVDRPSERELLEEILNEVKEINKNPKKNSKGR